jgi:hypothetical protein
MAAVAHQRNSRALPQPSAQDFFQDCFFFLAGPLATAAVETAKHARAPAVEAYPLDMASHRAQRPASPSQVAHRCLIWAVACVSESGLPCVVLYSA